MSKRQFQNLIEQTGTEDIRAIGNYLNALKLASKEEVQKYVNEKITPYIADVCEAEIGQFIEAHSYKQN